MEKQVGVDGSRFTGYVCFGEDKNKGETRGDDSRLLLVAVGGQGVCVGGVGWRRNSKLRWRLSGLGWSIEA